MASKDDDEAARKESPERAKADRESKSGETRAGGSAETLTSAVLGLAKLYAKGGENISADAVSDALLLILGSGPSIVALEGLLSSQGSLGMMQYNAVANQQKINMLSMAMTAKCVRYMLDPFPCEPLEETIINEEKNA